MHATSRSAVAPLLKKALSTSKILSAERERELLTRYHADGSKAAMDELVRSHMPIIFRVAGRSAQNPGLDINDLIQTATEGLLVAINRWSFEKSDASGARYATAIARETAAQQEGPRRHTQEPDSQDDAQAAARPPEVAHSSRLATYALWWMRIMLTNSVIDNRGVVVRAKSPKVRKALFGLPAAFKKLEISLPLSGNDVGRIAEHLGIEAQYIEEALVHASGDVMLDEPVGDGGLARGDLMRDERAEGEDGILDRLVSADCWEAVCAALLELSPRDRFILITRYLLTPKWKLDRLSGTLRMSRERIRQIGCDGLARIRGRVGADGGQRGQARGGAAAAVDALVARIERIAATSDPEAVAALLREQRITLGVTRVAARPVTPVAAPAKSLPPPSAWYGHAN